MRILSLILCALASPAMAQSNCGPRDAVLDFLTGKHGEIRQAHGVGPNNVMEVYANPISGTWTVTVTMPTGVMCLVASGTDFYAIPQGVAG
jgi:hypothetical protein